MRKICAKVVPKLLTIGPKSRWMEVCQDILERPETEPNLLQNDITGDNYGCSNMIRKPNDKVCNENVHIPQGQKRQGN